MDASEIAGFMAGEEPQPPGYGTILDDGREITVGTPVGVAYVDYENESGVALRVHDESGGLLFKDEDFPYLKFACVLWAYDM